MPQSEQTGVHRRLTLNSISNISRHALLVAVPFFMTPFIVQTLGGALYGFWVLLMSFIGYASILEMGVQPAVVKLVGQYRATDETGKLRELITAAFLFFLFTGGVAIIACLTVLPEFVGSRVAGIENFSRLNLLFGMIAVDATIMYMTFLLTGILYGCQRYHLQNIIAVGGVALNALLVFNFLERGGLLALMLSKLCVDTIVLLVSAVAVRRVFPELQISLGSVRWDSFRTLMSFGGRVFLSATTTRIASHSQPIIISASLSSLATGFYAIPVKMVGYTRTASWALTAAFMPMFSELNARNERSLLTEIYLNYSRYIFMILLPLPVAIFIYGPAFIGLWIGPEYEQQGRIALYLLTGVAVMESLQPLLWRFFIGVGNLNILVRVSAIVSLLTIVGSILMVKPLGISGVALSTLIGAVVAQAAYSLHTCRYLGISWIALVNGVNLRPLLVAAVVYGVARTLASWLGASSYLTILAGALVIAVLHFSLCAWIAITRQERESVRRKLHTLLLSLRVR